MKNKFVQVLAKGVLKVGQTIRQHGKTFVVVGFTAAGAALCRAAGGTDATAIAIDAQTAFGVIAPITITIAGFYVILKIAKKVVH